MTAQLIALEQCDRLKKGVPDIIKRSKPTKQETIMAVRKKQMLMKRKDKQKVTL
jgi:hypothetical protein